MKIRTIFIGLLILVLGCHKRPIDNKTANDKVSKNNNDFSIIDSLNKYSDTDSLFDFSNHKFYAGTTEKLKFGLVELNDTSFTLYQKKVSDWIITDTFNYPLFYVFKPQDLNGDTYKDVIITYSVAAAGGNGINICLLYNNQTKKLYHNKHFDLPNIRYDKNLDLVLSPWWGGATSCQYKESYKITGDSLVFYLGVMYCPNDNNEDETAGIQYYKIKRGKQIILKTLKGKPQKMWEVFEKAIWNSKDEY